MPATSPSGKPRVQLLVGGGRHTAGKAPSLARGRWEHQSLLHPQSADTHQLAFPPAPTRGGGKSRWSRWLSNQYSWPCHLAYLCTPLQLKGQCHRARNHYYMRARHCTAKRRKHGRGSGTIKTAANLLPCPVPGVIPVTTASGQHATAQAFSMTEAGLQLSARTVSWLLTITKLCYGQVADAAGSWPFLRSGRCSGTWLAGPTFSQGKAESQVSQRWSEPAKPSLSPWPLAARITKCPITHSLTHPLSGEAIWLAEG